jgi:hypothetical protein
MGEDKKVMTRRDFIRAGTCIAVGGLVGLPFVSEPCAEETPRSRVVLVRDQNVLDRQGLARGDVLQDMLDQAVARLLEETDPTAAWKQLFGPEDTVGVKSNVWYHLPTPRPLEEAIGKRLLDAGVKSSNMAFDDRGVLKNAVFKRATALINVRPMRSHHWSGVGSLLKNYIMFVPSPWAYHANACETLGAIWRLPHLKGKTRLNILVMLTPLFHGKGPHHFSSEHTWPYSGLIVSMDPVAADATGAKIIQAKRNVFFKRESPISPPPLHIAAADTRFGIGHSSPGQIELVRLGWEEDALI